MGTRKQRGLGYAAELAAHFALEESILLPALDATALARVAESCPKG